MSEKKKCRLCGEDISELHNRCVRCKRCQLFVRRLQNNTQRDKHRIYRKKRFRYWLRTLYVVKKIEQGKIKVNIFNLENGIEDIYKIYRKFRLRELYGDYLDDDEDDF